MYSQNLSQQQRQKNSKYHSVFWAESYFQIHLADSAKQKSVLTQSSHAHSFSFARPFVLKWQILFFFFSIFFYFIVKNKQPLKNMKNQNAKFHDLLYVTAT